MPGGHDGAAAQPPGPDQDGPGAHGDAEDYWERVDHLEESGAADKDFVVITRDRKGSPTWEVELKASHRSYAEAVCAGPFGVKMRKLGPASRAPRAACQRVASRVDPMATGAGARASCRAGACAAPEMNPRHCRPFT